MASRPAAEVDVTIELVRRLLTSQHPDLADLPLREVGHGWDNTILRLGDDLAVRLPRREVAAALVLHEQEWLPVVAAGLQGTGIGAPVPIRVGTPSPDYPWSWSVVPWFAGQRACDLAASERAPLAAPLADVVARLHVPAPASAPANPFRGVPLANRDASVRAGLASGLVPDARRLGRLWDDLSTTVPWAGPALWLHGDLHPANLIVADDGSLAAVLDFGDLTSGDPAVDLASAWLTFDVAGRRTFRARLIQLTDVDVFTWRRARAWALVLALAFTTHSDDDPVLAAIGAHALRALLDDDEASDSVTD